MISRALCAHSFKFGQKASTCKTLLALILVTERFLQIVHTMRRVWNSSKNVRKVFKISLLSKVIDERVSVNNGVGYQRGTQVFGWQRAELGFWVFPISSYRRARIDYSFRRFTYWYTGFTEACF